MTHRNDVITGNTESPKIDDNVHLLVLIHGLWGELSFFCNAKSKKKPRGT